MRSEEFQKQSQDGNSLNYNGKKRKKLIQESFRTCSETQQRKKLTIKMLLYLLIKYKLRRTGLVINFIYLFYVSRDKSKKSA